MGKAFSPQKHVIRTRLTSSHDAQSISHSVFCTRRRQSVPLATCIACPSLVSFPSRPAAIGAAVSCLTPDGDEAPSHEAEAPFARTLIRDVMNRKIACVAAHTGWESLEGLLLDDGVDAVPVVDADGKPIGIVSKTDLLRRTRSDEDELDGPITWPRTEPGMHIQRRAGITATDVMTPVVHALPEDAPMSFAFALLALERVSQIPIVSEYGAVVGLLSARDVVVWLARELGCIVERATLRP